MLVAVLYPWCRVMLSLVSYVKNIPCTTQQSPVYHSLDSVTKAWLKIIVGSLHCKAGEMAVDMKKSVANFS